MGIHPQAAAANNGWAWLGAAVGNLRNQIRAVAARPPTGMLAAQRLDLGVPSTSAAVDTPLWRTPPPFAETWTLLGVTATLTGTAVGAVSVQDDQGSTLYRQDAPFVADLGPFPPSAGGLTVAAVRTGGTGTVTVDVTSVRYGPHLADDPSPDADQSETEDVPDTFDGDVQDTG